MSRLGEILRLIRRRLVSDQEQRGGAHSTNIQAHSIVIAQGLSVTDVRDIALEVFRSNFIKLSGDAINVASERAREITDQFLSELQKHHPAGLAQAQDPDFQYALYTAQREYARCGDKELGDLLVDLLVDRTKHQQRSLLQIVLNESLVVAPKLTTNQLAALSVVFALRYTMSAGINSSESLFSYLDSIASPFVGLLDKKDACFQHLDYSGCGTIGIGSVELANVFRKHYKGLFSKGFAFQELVARGVAIRQDSPLITRCLHNSEKLQVNAMNDNVLRQEAAKLDTSCHDVDRLIALSEFALMNQAEAKNYLIATHPCMAALFDAWEGSMMKNLTLTSVGIAIGHANIKKTLGEFTDLRIWID